MNTTTDVTQVPAETLAVLDLARAYRLRGDRWTVRTAHDRFVELVGATRIVRIAQLDEGYVSVYVADKTPKGAFGLGQYHADFVHAPAATIARFALSAIA